MAITFGNLGIAEPSTITNRLGVVRIARGSTTEEQEILCFGDPESSIGLARVVATTPDSTHFGLVVREAAHSTGPFQISSIAGPVTVRSSAADLRATVYQSTAADLNVTVAGYSTTVNISSLAGPVIVRSSAADALVTVYQSTASALQTTARVNTSSGGAVEGSTASPSSGVLGLHVRPVHPPRRSVYSTITSTASSAFYTVISSAATKRVIKGYSLTSTAVGAAVVTFHSGTNAAIWHSAVGSQSSGVTGANLIDPTGLFETAAGEALTVRISSTGVEVQLSVASFPE